MPASAAPVAALVSESEQPEMAPERAAAVAVAIRILWKSFSILPLFRKMKYGRTRESPDVYAAIHAWARNLATIIAQHIVLI